MNAPRTASAASKALLLYGGWEGHFPETIAAFAKERLLTGFEVTESQDLAVLDPATLASFDLLVLIWTFGELTEEQEAALCNAVRDGMGLVAWHGAASSFHASRPYKHLLGGQFVAHPGGNAVPYHVKFNDDPLTRGLEDFSIASEQYYLIVDPAVTVIATTQVVGCEMPWLSGVKMPVAWWRNWGTGRVFYSSLGHTKGLLQHPSVAALLQRGIAWATRPR
jgi:type 1 glutamine amidotransferase